MEVGFHFLFVEILFNLTGYHMAGRSAALTLSVRGCPKISCSLNAFFGVCKCFFFGKFDKKVWEAFETLLNPPFFRLVLLLFLQVRITV